MARVMLPFERAAVNWIKAGGRPEDLPDDLRALYQQLSAHAEAEPPEHRPMIRARALVNVAAHAVRHGRLRFWQGQGVVESPKPYRRFTATWYADEQRKAHAAAMEANRAERQVKFTRPARRRGRNALA